MAQKPAQTFPDRQEQMFGRSQDIKVVLGRMRERGLSALVGRQMMGKTWVVKEASRLLVEEGRSIVGYYDALGTERSHLLHAVGNLYQTWLSDSTMFEQAVIEWRRLKPTLGKRAIHSLGPLLEKVFGKDLPLVSFVPGLFAALARAQDDLMTGGLKVDPLPYEDALSLVQLVAELSRMRPVLVLDAWEKSAALQSEARLLESMLQRLGEWPDLHIVLVLRDPLNDTLKTHNEALSRVQDLERGSPTRLIHPLEEMNLTGADGSRIVQHVRSLVPGSASLTDQEVLQSIDGYPGVLYFWMHEFGPREGRANSLQELAERAHKARYVELERRLEGQAEPALVVAAQLAFLPQLSEEAWALFTPSLTHVAGTADLARCVDDLIEGDVLIEFEGVPGYGHDSRFAAARRWFLERRGRLARRVCEGLLDSLARRVDGLLGDNELLFEGMAFIGVQASGLSFGPTTRCLLAAANIVTGRLDDIVSRSLDETSQSVLRTQPHLGVAVYAALLVRAMTTNVIEDPQKVIADCTAVIDQPDMPGSFVVDALIKRGLAWSVMDGEADAAIRDFTAAIDHPDIPAVDRSRTLYHRAIIHVNCARPELARGDVEAAFEVGEMPLYGATMAFNLYGDLKRIEDGDFEGAIQAYEEAIGLHEGRVEEVAESFLKRAMSRQGLRDYAGAISDYTLVVDSGIREDEALEKALLRRADLRREARDFEAALADVGRLIGNSEFTAETLSEASLLRGRILSDMGQCDNALSDFEVAFGWKDAGENFLARALLGRATLHQRRGRLDLALADLDRLLLIGDGAEEVKPEALSLRTRWHGNH